MLEVKDIYNLQKKNKTDFSFQYEERKFELRAKDEAECDKWIFSLEFVKGYITNLDAQKQETHIDLRISSTVTEKRKEKWKINNLDSNTFNEIQSEHERNFINQKQDAQNSSTIEDFNHILDLKGIKSFIEKLDPRIVKTRLCIGFLSKKGKNNITRYKKRFCVLISAKPLSSGIKDDFILKEEDLPPWLELEAIYYFQCKNNEDNSPFIGKISLRNVLSITVEDNQTKNALEKIKDDFIDFSSNLKLIKGLFSWEMNLGLSKPEHGFGFTLATKDRTYYFYADLITEMNKWIIAIEQSSKNYKELHPEFSPEQDLTIHDKSPRRKMQTQTLRKAFDDLKDNEGLVEISLFSKQKSHSKELGERGNGKEGYLFKKKLTTNKLRKLIGWKQKYVVLKEECIYWVENNTVKSNFKKKNFPLSRVKQCESHKEDQFLLTLADKKYKFRAENKEERDRWLQIINKTRGSIKPIEESQMTISSESEVINVLNPNGTVASMEILKANVTRQEENEDSIFARFYALSEEKPNQKNDSPSESLMKHKAPAKVQETPKRQCYCFSKLMCCFFKRQPPEVEDDEYYNQL